MGDVEVWDMDDESGTSTPKKVVIDIQKFSEYLNYPPIETAGLGKGSSIVWKEKGQTD